MPLPLETTLVCTALIGRTAYLASLKQLAEQAAKGDGQVILLAGEAGIGKSRLIQEVLKAVFDLHFQVLVGHSFEVDANLPYASLLNLLGNHWAGFTPEKLKQTLKSFGDLSGLGLLLPELQHYLPENNNN